MATKATTAQFESSIKLVADDVQAVRVSDVYRLLEAADEAHGERYAKALAAYLVENRKDKAIFDETMEVLRELFDRQI